MTPTRKRVRFDLRRDLGRVIGILAALFVLNLGFYLFLNMPRLRALSDLTSGRDEIRRALVASSKRCNSMREKVRRYDEELERLEEFFNERLGRQIDRMTAIQKEIRSVAVEFRIDPNSIDYRSSEAEGSDMTQFQIIIPLVGGYPNLRQFIERLESSPSLFIIDSVELAGSKGGGAMLSLTIRLSTFFKSPPRIEQGETSRRSASRTRGTERGTA